MTKYVFIYEGGDGMAATPEEQEKTMAEWTAWFGTIGNALVDGGNPFTQAKKLGSDGSVADSGGLSGYSVITAASLDAAVDVAKGCPLLSSATGAVTVYETIDM